uniref:Uncharacterized protein n=1 Tax=Ananas comosus var. bracteatus TaxID=296719 RepID=A0A6V7PXJ3_ANACO|nr:unnamed protein product [Ananas comosus var. bracteatus]
MPSPSAATNARAEGAGGSRSPAAVAPPPLAAPQLPGAARIEPPGAASRPTLQRPAPRSSCISSDLGCSGSAEGGTGSRAYARNVLGHLLLKSNNSLSGTGLSGKDRFPNAKSPLPGCAAFGDRSPRAGTGPSLRKCQ